MQNGSFSSKRALPLKKVCYKVSSCKYCQRQSCKAFSDIHLCKMVCGAIISTWKFGRNWPTIFENYDFQNANWLFSSKIWTILCENFKTVQDTMSALALITNTKSLTGFRLVPTLVTLNEHERRKNISYIALYIGIP